MRIMLRTARLDLRELAAEDHAAVLEILADPEVERWFAKRFTATECEAWIARQRARYARDGYGYWLSLERDTGIAVGLVGPLRLEAGGSPEPGLGWIIRAGFRGHGFAAEAAAACRDWLFAGRPCPRVVTVIRPDHAQSLRVAEKLGMTVRGRTLYQDLEHLLLAVDRDAR